MADPDEALTCAELMRRWRQENPDRVAAFDASRRLRPWKAD
jgi:hypothetical protein